MVEVPIDTLRRGDLFASGAALDAFVRVLSVGSASQDREEEQEKAPTE